VSFRVKRSETKNLAQRALLLIIISFLFVLCGLSVSAHSSLADFAFAGDYVLSVEQEAGNYFNADTGVEIRAYIKTAAKKEIFDDGKVFYARVPLIDVFQTVSISEDGEVFVNGTSREVTWTEAAKTVEAKAIKGEAYYGYASARIFEWSALVWAVYANGAYSYNITVKGEKSETNAFHSYAIDNSFPEVYYTGDFIEYAGGKIDFDLMLRGNKRGDENKPTADSGILSYTVYKNGVKTDEKTFTGTLPRTYPYTLRVENSQKAKYTVLIVDGAKNQTLTLVREISDTDVSFDPDFESVVENTLDRLRSKKDVFSEDILADLEKAYTNYRYLIQISEATKEEKLAEKEKVRPYLTRAQKAINEYLGGERTFSIAALNTGYLSGEPTITNVSSAIGSIVPYGDDVIFNLAFAEFKPNQKQAEVKAAGFNGAKTVLSAAFSIAGAKQGSVGAKNLKADLELNIPYASYKTVSAVIAYRDGEVTRIESADIRIASGYITVYVPVTQCEISLIINGTNTNNDLWWLMTLNVIPLGVASAAVIRKVKKKKLKT